MALGLGFLQYKKLGAQLDKAQKELKRACETAIVLSDLDDERRRFLAGKVEVCRLKVDQLEQQIGAKDA